MKFLWSVKGFTRQERRHDLQINSIREKKKNTNRNSCNI